MEGTMLQVLAIAAAAVALALLGCPTHAGCAIGKDQATSPEAIQLLASHRAQPDRWIIDGLGTSLTDNASINATTNPATIKHGCWFDLDLPQCE